MLRWSIKWHIQPLVHIGAKVSYLKSRIVVEEQNYTDKLKLEAFSFLPSPLTLGVWRLGRSVPGEMHPENRCMGHSWNSLVGMGNTSVKMNRLCKGREGISIYRPAYTITCHISHDINALAVSWLYTYKLMRNVQTNASSHCGLGPKLVHGLWPYSLSSW